MVFSEMRDTLGNPPLMLVDLRPVTYPMLLISDLEIAEQVSRGTKAFPKSIPKSETEKHTAYLLGPTSILTEQGETWSELRKKFNPGFAPAHLMTLLPRIVEKIPKFLGHLDDFAKSGDDFSLAYHISNLMFDIIGNVVMDVNLEAQNESSRQSELIRLYRELLFTYINDSMDSPWWLIPRTELKRRRLAKRIDELLRAIIHRKHDARQALTEQGIDAGKSRSILSLSLQDSTTLTPEVVNEACDQLKTFLFAGHDTTSIMLSWAFYELSRTPRVLQSLQRELDTLLGTETDPSVVFSRILESGPDVLSRMAFTNAVIKEVLRLHPPASTARMTKPGTGYTLRTADGTEHCVDGSILYICHSVIQRDPEIWGASADVFVPERWLDETATSDPDIAAAARCRASAPVSAWRPFERGPRNCIGQDFAKIEAYVILAVVARRYEFVKVGLGEIVRDELGRPVMGKTGQHEVKFELYKVCRPGESSSVLNG